MKFLGFKWTYMTTSDAFANEAEYPYVLSYIEQVIPVYLSHFFLSLSCLRFCLPFNWRPQ